MFKEYSNASAVNAENIPQNVIASIAEMLYNILLRTESEEYTIDERRTANER